jgi:hypothetical protein
VVIRAEMRSGRKTCSKVTTYEALEVKCGFVLCHAGIL